MWPNVLVELLVPSNLKKNIDILKLLDVQIHKKQTIYIHIFFSILSDTIININHLFT